MAPDDVMIKKVKKANEAKDIQKIIRLLLDSPISSDGPVAEIDGSKPLKALQGKPLDVKTALLVGITLDALATRDLKLTEFLFKYGGLEPVKKQEVAIEMPTIVDDIDFEITESQTPRVESKPVCDIKVIDADLGD